MSTPPTTTYSTPDWVTETLVDSFLIPLEDRPVWDPACGSFAIVNTLNKRGVTAFGSDIKYGSDFFKVDYDARTIITNPPFSLAEKFVHRALEFRDVSAVYMLLRLAFLEGQKRKETLWKVCPPNYVAVLSRRVTMYPDGAERKGSGTMAMAWFVWYRNSFGLYGEDKCKMEWL